MCAGIRHLCAGSLQYRLARAWIRWGACGPATFWFTSDRQRLMVSLCEPWHREARVLVFPGTLVATAAARRHYRACCSHPLIFFPAPLLIVLMKGSSAKPRKSTSKCACVACAANKRKCSGERPCGRCARLNIPCVDKLDKRSRAYREMMAKENTAIVSVVQPKGKFKRKLPSKGARAVASLLHSGPDALHTANVEAKAPRKKGASKPPSLSSVEME